jgi:hypothetical protein
MFKSFTSGDSKPAAKGGRPSPADDTAVSAGAAAVARAARLMRGGAAATIIWGIYWLVVALSFRSDTANYYVKTLHLSQAKANSQVNGGLLIQIVEVVLFVTLWLWMARLNRDRQNWARIASTVFFIAWSFETYAAIRGLGTYIALGNLIIMLLVWGAGLGALYYLWRPESREYFQRLAR